MRKIPQKYHPNKASLLKGQLVFEEDNGFARALSEGFFHIKMPDELDLSGLERLGKNFYRDPESDQEAIYCGYKNESVGELKPHVFRKGYLGRKNNQVESLYTEKDVVEEHYPPEVVDASHIMAQLSIGILRSVLMQLKIPKHLWDQATNGCTKEDADFSLGFNHYRPEKETSGAVTHKDSSLVTLLHSVEPGLEAWIEKQWIPIDPLPGYLTVNFGAVLDVLTKDLETPAVASLHRVIRQHKKGEKERFSVVLYLQPSVTNVKANVYSYKEEALTYVKTYHELLASLVPDYDEIDGLPSFDSEVLADSTISRSPVVLMPSVSDEKERKQTQSSDSTSDIAQGKHNLG